MLGGDYQTKIATYTTSIAWSCTPPVAPDRPELQPTAIPLLRGRPPPRQSRYKLPVCKNPILPLPPSKSPDRSIDTITSAYQPPKIEDGLVDVDANEPDLNTDF